MKNFFYFVTVPIVINMSNTVTKTYNTRSKAVDNCDKKRKYGIEYYNNYDLKNIKYKKIIFKKIILKDNKFIKMSVIEETNKLLQTFNRTLTAYDISFILKKYKLDFNKVCIIGCAEHLIKSLKTDINKPKKAYICYFNSHWFVVLYITFLKKKYIITFDSFGSVLPVEYRNSLFDFYKHFEYYYCPSALQTDGFSCGLFALSYVINIFKTLKISHMLNPVNILKAILKENIFKTVNQLTKILINEPNST